MKADRAALPARGHGPWLVVWTLVGGGLALLALGIWLLIPALRSSAWPDTQGMVTGHRIETLYLNRATNYFVGVDYAYEVEHARHAGHVFSHASAPLPMAYPSREAAETAYASDPNLQGWQIGQGITVSYDPRNPAESVLKKGACSLPLAVCLLGTGLIGIAAWEARKLRRKAAISGDESSTLRG